MFLFIYLSNNFFIYLVFFLFVFVFLLWANTLDGSKSDIFLSMKPLLVLSWLSKARTCKWRGIFTVYGEVKEGERGGGGRDCEGAQAVRLQTLSDLCFFNQRGEFDLEAVSKQSTLLPCIAKQTEEGARTVFLSQAGGNIFQQRWCSHMQSKSPNSFICHMDGQFSRGLLLLSHRSP